LPIILSKKVASLKTKEFYIFLRKIFGEKLFNVAIKHRKTRCGVGKMRGRRYKSNAGLLMIKNSNEKIKINGIDIIDAKKVKIKDMALNGIRLIIFTEDSIEELKKRINEK
jgi:ribosomal protein L4